MNFKEKVIEAQEKLKAPKDQFNDYGGFKYRSCEGILEAAKPVLKELGLVLNLTDEIVTAGDRVYIKATAMLIDGGDTNDSIQATAFAREPEEKKGMDASQVTGTASSYARKYALNALFCIDDTKDADTDEYQKQTANSKPQSNSRSGKQSAQKSAQKTAPKEEPKPVEDVPDNYLELFEQAAPSVIDEAIAWVGTTGINPNWLAALYHVGHINDINEAMADNILQFKDKIIERYKKENE